MRERLLTSKELDQLLRDTLKLIDGEERLLPKTDEFKGVSELYIEISLHGYEYVCRDERGNEVFRKCPMDLNELLYQVFSDVTYQIAVLDKNAMTTGDFRQALINKHVELMRKLSPKWAERMKQ